MIDRRNKLQRNADKNPHENIYHAVDRYLNVASIVKYSLDNEEYILGNDQILEFADLRYHLRTTPFSIIQSRQEMLSAAMVVGGKDKLMPPTTFQDALEDIEEGKQPPEGIFKWFDRLVTNPSGRFSLQATEYIGVGLYRDEHTHMEVPLQEHFHNVETELQEELPRVPSFYIEDRSSYTKLFCVNTGSFIPVQAVAYPYTPYTPLENNKVYSKRFSDEDLADKIERLFHRQKIYMGMQCFDPLNMILDERIPTSHLENLYPEWGSVPFNIDTGYAALDNYGLFSINRIMGHSSIQFNRKPKPSPAKRTIVEIEEAAMELN